MTKSVVTIFFLFFPENRIWHFRQIVSNFPIFPENRIWHFMQTVFIEDNLPEISNPVFWEKGKLETICLKCQILFSGKNKKNILIWVLKTLPGMLRVKGLDTFGKVFTIFHYENMSIQIYRKFYLQKLKKKKQIKKLYFFIFLLKT